MRIEKARSEHIPAIAALEARCFSDPWPAELIGRLLERFSVCLDGDALAGYIVLSFVLDEGSVDNVATAPERRRQGVGDALMACADGFCQKNHLASLTLEVRAGNLPAVRLYEKHGFARAGLRRGYYEKPREDAIIMTKVFELC